MPFKVTTTMDQRREFVLLADQEGVNRRALCRRFGISPTTGKKWRDRAHAEGLDALGDRSRRPHTAPSQTPPDIEARVIAVRTAHPTWGGRKIHAWLRDRGGLPTPPVPSTITGILHRAHLIDPGTTRPLRYGRFEHAAPNDLVQLDFMGHRAMQRGRVHPLTLIDDHSRFVLGLWACPHEQGVLVQRHLTACFARYGLPQALLTDNGPPWGSAWPGAITWLEAWLIRLGIRVVHGRFRHPQTQGKIERWHRTLGTDLFQFGPFPDLAATQAAFDTFRTTYNTERPHDALGLAVPASRYQPSPRSFPERLPEIVYSEDHTVQVVTDKGWIWVAQQKVFISEALRGLPVGVRPTSVDGVFVVRYCDQAIKRIDLRSGS